MYRSRRRMKHLRSRIRSGRWRESKGTETTTLRIRSAPMTYLAMKVVYIDTGGASKSFFLGEEDGAHGCLASTEVIHPLQCSASE